MDVMEGEMAWQQKHCNWRDLEAELGLVAEAQSLAGISVGVCVGGGVDKAAWWQKL